MKPPILLARHGSVERGTVEVYENEGSEGGDRIDTKLDNLRFMSEGSLAGDLFVWGIARWLVNLGKQALLIHNPEDDLGLDE